jgi:hypothetical protein
MFKFESSAEIWGRSKLIPYVKVSLDRPAVVTKARLLVRLATLIQDTAVSEAHLVASQPVNPDRTALET